jgi:hypothetical protein
MSSMKLERLLIANSLSREKQTEGQRALVIKTKRQTRQAMVSWKAKGLIELLVD